MVSRPVGEPLQLIRSVLRTAGSLTRSLGLRRRGDRAMWRIEVVGGGVIRRTGARHAPALWLVHGFGEWSLASGRGRRRARESRVVVEDPAAADDIGPTGDAGAR